MVLEHKVKNPDDRKRGRKVPVIWEVTAMIQRKKQKSNKRPVNQELARAGNRGIE